MENVQRESPITEHPDLANRIISEYDLCLLLGISAATLDDLRRSRKIPYIALNRNNRVYSVPEVLNWLDKLPKP